MRGRPDSRLLVPGAVVLAAAVVTAIVTGCGGGKSGSDKPSTAQVDTKPTRAARSSCACNDTAAQARLGAFVSVAKRIYAREHADVVGRVVAKHLSKNAALIRALRAGDRPAVRRLARGAVVVHEVRVRIVRGSKVLMDAGLPFVVQGAEAEIRDQNGVSLGHVQVSIQDLIGFVKLVTRETGTQAVVRDQSGTTQTLLPAAAHARLPKSGKVTLAGRSYLVRSFHEAGFVGNPLTVWILDPA
jgi:hypothetical protein